MQIYAIKMHNFLRYGEKDNTLVFDLTNEQKEKILDGKLTMDEVYNKVVENPSAHIENVKKRGITNILGILGKTDENWDRSNASGKSTIMEAICYCHYDKIARKLTNTDKTEKAGSSVIRKINDKLPEDLREMYVEEIFEEHGKIYRLRRGRSFSKTQKTSTPILEFECYDQSSNDIKEGHRKDDTEESIANVITTSFDVFLNGQMFAQNDAGKFLSGSDKIKKETIIKLLKLDDIVGNCLSNIRTRKSQALKSSNQSQGQVEMLENMLLQAIQKWECGEHYSDENIKQTLKSIRQHIQQKEKEIKSFDQEIEKAEKEITDLSEKMSQLKKDNLKEQIQQIQAEKEKALADLKEKIDQIDKNINDFKKQQQSNNQHIKSIDEKINNSKQRISKIQKYCQEDKFEKAKKVIEKNKQGEKKKEELDQKIKDLQKQRDDYRDAITNAQTLSTECMTLVKNMQYQLDQNKGDNFVCEFCSSEVTKEHLTQEIEKQKQKSSEYQKQINHNKSGQDEIDKQIADINEKQQKISDLAVRAEKAQKYVEQYTSSKEDIEYLQKEIDGEQKQKEGIQKTLTEIENKIQEAEKNKHSVQKQIDEQSVSFDERKKKLQDQLKDKNDQISKLADLLEGQRLNKKDITYKRNYHNSDIGKFKQEGSEIKNQAKKLKEYHQEHDEQTRNVKRLEFLENAFGLGGIQTRVVSKWIPLLNVYIKEFMDILTDGRIHVKCFINERSEVDIKLIGASAGSYEMCSGGEKNIIRLGVDIGLALLSFARLSEKPDLICMDEIFGSLDNQYIESVFKMISHLQNRFSRVLIISHKTDIKTLLKDNIIVGRTGGENGISSVRCIAEFDDNRLQ